MTSDTGIALTGFIALALFLIILMELLRTWQVVRGQIAINQFRPDNANLSPFMQRLARAHANCIEGLPIFGGLLVVALLTGQAAITDPLAYALLAARLVQVAAHLASSGVPVVTLRAAAFAAQMVIGAYWAFRLLALFLGQI